MMRHDAKLFIKLALIFFGLMFLFCIRLGMRHAGRQAPEGEKISVEDVGILLDALDVNVDLNGGEEYLTYGQYITIRQSLDGESLGLPDYADRYETGHELLKEDWYEAYRLLLAHLDTKSSIWETTVFLLKVDAETKEAYTENGAMQGSYTYVSSMFEENVFQEARVYVKGDVLLTVIEVLPKDHDIENVWVMERSDGVMECFYRQVVFSVNTGQEAEREQVADLTFRDGKVIRVKQKKKKIHGKLLRVSDSEMDIEGWGTYQTAEGMEVYKLYGSLETLTAKDLKIGYADTDFVVEKGKICCCLVSREEKADKIRVLLKNPVSHGNYYDAVTLTVNGETVRIQAKELKDGERRVYESAALTDKIIVDIEGITKEDNAYRGTIECYKTPEGLVLINELPLEEYLYAVVPSEMPASYPLEALKAQAVCARTYAYCFILHAGLPEMGAHVDDTVSYQVYHNCAEHSASTTAVKETDGVLLTYQGEPAENYYYSTSCGVGTDERIWKQGEDDAIPYMRAVRLNEEADAAITADGDQETEETNLDKLQEEEYFRQFIDTVHEDDLEKGEPWYRWQYTVKELDEKVMLKRIKERYQADPDKILTLAEGGYYVSEPVERLGNIRQLTIEKRGAGGVAEELVIAAEHGTFKIISEYNIRSVLCDGASSVVRQDGSIVTPASLLPSGFFVIDAGKKRDNVIGYNLIGGGYGHGAGMSQNGAKALGNEGLSYDRILERFFPGCELEQYGAD